MSQLSIAFATVFMIRFVVVMEKLTATHARLNVMEFMIMKPELVINYLSN